MVSLPNTVGAGSNAYRLLDELGKCDGDEERHRLVEEYLKQYAAKVLMQSKLIVGSCFDVIRAQVEED